MTAARVISWSGRWLYGGVRGAAGGRRATGTGGRAGSEGRGGEGPGRYGTEEVEVSYPGSAQSCDLCLGDPPTYSWAFEIKALRLLGDKGHTGVGRDDVSKILSPYPQQHSALTDCVKLVSSGLAHRQAIVIYAYDWPDFPALAVIEIFEMAATQRVTLGPRVAHPFEGLIHPVHQQGAVYGWELLSR